ncbi:MAG: hypothetical protein JXA14_10200 [Anaerolineae bacterium]|nr:hypothetical protein [Anaerolineae bacterium]
MMYELARAQANTRYVATSGVDGGNCLDPDNPCRTVQYAVDVSAGNETIKVAAGTYTDLHDRPALPGDPYSPLSGVVRQVVFISQPVTIRGGYLAADFGRVPDPTANPTILDANGQGRVFYVAGEITTTLEGLVVTGGRIGDPAVDPGYGGGFYIVSTTVTISDCTLHDNEAVPLYAEDDPPFPVSGGEGGALYAQNADVSILGSRAEGNRAWHGGALYLHGGMLTLLGSDVLCNAASADVVGFGTSGSGGGLYLTGTRASLLGGAVTGNHSSGRGGGLQLVDSHVILDQVTIAENSAVASTVGYFYGVGGGLWATSSQITMTSNTVAGNFAYGGRFALSGGGAGLHVVDSHVTLLKGAVQRNYAEMAPCGALCFSNSTLYVENTLITDNAIRWYSRDQENGALDLKGSTATLGHVTLASNTGVNPVGIYVSEGSVVTMTNGMLVSHTQAIRVAASGMATLEATAWGTGAWANDADWGGDGTIVTGTINVWGDPAFVDPAAGDYHISRASIARDGGIPARILDDIDGEPRPDGCFYDIGADEVLTGTPCWRLYLPLVVRLIAQRQ